MDVRSIEEADRQLERRRWDSFAKTALALGVGALAAPTGLLRVALAIGAAFGIALALVSAVRRRWLIERLALDPDAYVIAEVRRYGRRLTSRRKRERLSRSLRSVVADPWRCGPCIPPGRLEAFAGDLEELARELEDTRFEVQPVTAAGCRHLLSDAVESPLLNPEVPVEELRAALWRIRSGIRHAA